MRWTRSRSNLRVLNQHAVRWIVENSLGRLWYEMRQGRTELLDQCQMMLRRPDEVFFSGLTVEPDEVMAWVVRGAHAMQRPPSDWHLGPFKLTRSSGERLWDLTLVSDAYFRHPLDGDWGAWVEAVATNERLSPADLRSQDLMDILFYANRALHWGDPTIGGFGYLKKFPRAIDVANELRRRVLSRWQDDAKERLLQQIACIPYRELIEPNEILVVDLDARNGELLLEAFDLLQAIYREARTTGEASPGIDIRDGQTPRPIDGAQVALEIIENSLVGVCHTEDQAADARAALLERIASTGANVRPNMIDRVIFGPASGGPRRLGVREVSRPALVLANATPCVLGNLIANEERTAADLVWAVRELLIGKSRPAGYRSLQVTPAGFRAASFTTWSGAVGLREGSGQTRRATNDTEMLSALIPEGRGAEVFDLEFASTAGVRPRRKRN